MLFLKNLSADRCFMYKAPVQYTTQQSRDNLIEEIGVDVMS
jgi:hypothetical protein